MPPYRASYVTGEMRSYSMCRSTRYYDTYSQAFLHVHRASLRGEPSTVATRVPGTRVHLTCRATTVGTVL
eukprot:458901-Rhodomonas_salina.1